ncbi:MAG: asparagine synthase-related protein [Acidobacteriota bacterium]
MSGIAGVVYTDQRPVEIATLDAMVRATAPPGIDGAQTWHNGPAGLIRFALAATPEAVGENQPVTEPRSGLTIAFDGRLDNRAELLDLPEAPPATAPDCTIVLAAFLHLGDSVVNRLVGDYALAIWNPARRRLFCARSPIGWRPFLWTYQGDRFAFATEPATLIRGLGLERRLNEGAIGEHLSSRFVTETDTFWDGVQRLPPGHALALEHGHVRRWRWHTGPFEDLARLSDADHIDRFKTLLDQALIAVSRSAGPVAAHLSGGLDSSTVVCRTRELVDAGRIARMVQPYSARFPDEISDEGEWIAAAEAKSGTRSEVVFGAPFDSAAAANWCAATLHLPLRPNTASVVVAVCERLRDRGIRVLLTGEGGDDWISGSRAHWPDLLLQGRWPALFREGLAAGPGASWTRGLRAILASALGPIVSPRRRARTLRPHLDFNPAPPVWIGREWAGRIGLSDRWRSAPRPPALSCFAQAQRYHVYALARRHVNIDNAIAYAAGRGVELRHPLHDLRLTRFLMGAAGHMLRRAGQKKHLLREAMRGTLPEVVRTRTTKANIAPPIIDGVTARLTERPIRELHCVRLGWVDGVRLEQYQAAHAAWRHARTAADIPMEPYTPVWNAIATDLWLEHAFGM